MTWRTLTISPRALRRMITETGHLATRDSDGNFTNVGTLQHSFVTHTEKYREEIADLGRGAAVLESYAQVREIGDVAPQARHILRTAAGRNYVIRYVQRWPDDTADATFYRLLMEQDKRYD